MRVSVRWLQELVRSDVPADRIAGLLGDAGLPAEETIRLGEPFDKAVVAEVVSVQDRSVTLFDGRGVVEIEGATAQLAPDFKVAFHLDRKRIITEQEVGIENSPAAVQLPSECETGSPVLNTIDDCVLVLELPPNRGDLTGVVGVARELACCLGQQFELPAVELKEAAEPISACFQLAVKDPADTPDYIARLVRGVHIAPSPFWLKWRLLACGVRSISNVVDVTNYILFMYGQPLHGFDFQHLTGARIVTRRAQPGEKMATIDGVERQLTGDVLVIADAERPVALAGIMGGLESEITETTRDVLIECARFSPAVIRRGSRTLGLSTEASQRFEVGLDAGMMDRASRAASAMIQSLAGGETLAGSAEVRSPVPERSFRLSWDKTNRLLGLRLPSERMTGILTRLGCIVMQESEGARVGVPSSRFDIETPADLAEEIGRIVGYHEIPSNPVYTTGQPGRRHKQSLRAARIREIMTGLGVDEIQTLSLVSETLPPAFGVAEPARLLKPLNERFAVLRPSLLVSILDSVSLNLRRGNRDLRFYEIGSIYRNGVNPGEATSLGGILTGARDPLFWTGKPDNVDFYDASGTIAGLLRALGIGSPDIRPASAPGFDPAAAAEVVIGEQRLGTVGAVDRAVAEKYDIAEPVFAWELDWDRLWALAPTESINQPLPRFQSVVRDFALVLDAAVPAARLLQEVRRVGSDLTTLVEIFDHYAGKSLPAGKRSIGIRVTLRAGDRTLTSAEVDEFSLRLTTALRKLLGAEIRQ